MTAAFNAFREPYLVTHILDSDDFADFDARRLRYAIYWSFFENTAYRDVHTWAQLYKTRFGIYRYTRNIYNPAGRLGEFWQTHLLGGALDPLAGDGEGEPTAIPILTENEDLRPAIAQIWEWSNWQQKKDLLSLFGATMGDVGLRINDDPVKRRVYLEVIHPTMIQSIDKDTYGHVKGYVLSETRNDPESSTGHDVTYMEVAERDGDNVVYNTYKNGNLYAWNGVTAQWELPYGFVPFIHIPHIDVGTFTGGWGWAEMHQLRSKIQEVDDLASKLDDQIRKTVDSVWLFSGVKKNETTKETTSKDATENAPLPGREELPAFYSSNAEAKATPLVAPLDIAGANGQIQSLLQEIERDYPELQMDIWTAGGDNSGRALRIARQRSESKVYLRRMAYDRALQDAHQMAVAIGGWRGYAPEFGSFGLDSYAQGDLDHIIGQRPVFANDPLDKLEEDKLFWDTAAVAVEKTGITLEAYLRLQGWDDEKVRMATKAQRREEARNLRQRARRVAVPASAGGIAGSPETSMTEGVPIVAAE
jgi:hypothetical protein